MARLIACVVTVLLLAATPGRAAGVYGNGLCEKDKAAQQRGASSAAGQKAEKPGEPGRSHPGPPKWWIDQKLRAELGVTDQQSAAVDQVWKKSMPTLLEGRERLEKLEDALSEMTQRDGSDETAVIAQIERVENLRAELAKGRTLMIYRMNKILTVDQRAKVKAMYEQRRDPPRRGSSPR
jgi:Spy/CpxP family protein refolding chaperone